MYENSRNWIPTFPNEFLLWRLKLCRCLESLGQRCKQQHCLNWDLLYHWKDLETQISKASSHFYLEIWISNYVHKSDCIENQFSNLTPNHSQKTWIKLSMIRTSHMALKCSHQRLETLPLMTFQLEFKCGNYFEKMDFNANYFWIFDKTSFKLKNIHMLFITNVLCKRFASQHTFWSRI
jgi:hypothetical protein